MQLKIEKQKVTTFEFLAAFKGCGPFYIRTLADVSREECTNYNFSKNVTIKDQDQLRRYIRGDFVRFNNHRNGIFFVVNNGGHSDSSITEITAQYIDFDHVPMDVQHAKLEEFGLLPSIITMPNRGFHCYWLVRDAFVSDFRRLQERLITFFGSDPTIKNESRVMRVPGFFHQKGDPKMVDIQWWHPETVYTQEQLHHRLTELGIPEVIESKKPIRAEKRKTYKEGKKLPSSVDQTLLTMVGSHLGNLYTINGEHTCLCPYHDDHRPSGVYFAENEWFYCHACAQSWSLSQMAEDHNWSDVDDYLKKRHLENRRRFEERYQKDIAKRLRTLPKLPLYVHAKTKTESLGAQRTIRAVMEEFEHTMAERGLSVSESLRKSVEQILRLWETATNINQPIIWPANPGSGKSTLRNLYIRHKCAVDPTFGCVLVTERKEDADDIATYLNQELHIAWSYLGWDEAWCVAGHSVYEKGMCKGCVHSHCRVLRNMEEQRRHPVVITTHQRLANLSSNGQLGSTFDYWVDGNGERHERKLLIFDEAPPMMEQSTFRRTEVEQLQKKLEKVLCDQSHILDEWRSVWHKLIEFLLPIHASRFVSADELAITLSSHFKKTVAEIPDTFVWEGLMDFIQLGGIYNPDTDDGWKITTMKQIPYKWDGFRPFILDGTGVTDLRYHREEYQVIASPVIQEPPIRMQVCTDFGFGKRFMHTHDLDQVLAAHVDVIQSLTGTRRKVLVVVRKEYEVLYRQILHQELAKQLIVIDHFGNLKGKNDYQDCDTIVFFGVLDKGDEYYASSAILNHKQPESLCLEGKEYANIHRFEDIELEMGKLNEIALELEQDMYRTQIRRSQPIDVYIFSRDVILMEHVGCMVGISEVDFSWKPTGIAHLTKPGQNVSAVFDTLKEFIESGSLSITKAEIKLRAGVADKTDKVWRRVWQNPYVVAFCRENGIYEPSENSRIILRSLGDTHEVVEKVG